MASRKWLSVFALASMLAVGLLVRMQSVTLGEEGEVFDPNEAYVGESGAAVASEKQLELSIQQSGQGGEEAVVSNDSDSKFAVYKLKYANAIKSAQQLFYFYPAYKITADERTNSLLAFGGKKVHNDVKEFVRTFDVPSDIAPDPAQTIVRFTWEYRSGRYDDASANKMGKEGWELVTVYSGGREVDDRAVYKRPVQPMQQGFQKGMMPWEWGYQPTNPEPLDLPERTSAESPGRASIFDRPQPSASE